MLGSRPVYNPDAYRRGLRHWLELTRQKMIDAVVGVEGVLPDRPQDALFLELGDSTLLFRVRWWLESYGDTCRMFGRVNTAL